MTDSEAYYVRRQGRVEGPWSIDKLRSEAKLRKLGRHHEVSLDGELWQRAQEIDGLFSTVVSQKVVHGATAIASELQLDLNDDGTFNSKDVAPHSWYCSINDEPVGPMSIADLLAVLTSGRAALDDLVWRDGFANWMPVEDVPELMERLERTRTTNTAHDHRTLRDARSSWLAVFSLAAGIAVVVLSWLPVIGLLGGLPAITSIIAMYRIKKSSGALGGMGLAVTGLVLSVLAFVIGLLVLLGFAVWLSSR